MSSTVSSVIPYNVKLTALAMPSFISDTIQYYWYKNNEFIGTGASLNSTVTVLGETIFKLVVRGSSGLFREEILRAFGNPALSPVIQSVTATKNSLPIPFDTDLTVNATDPNSLPLSYIWYNNGVEISRYQTFTYTVNSVQPVQLSVVVTNTSGKSASSVIILQSSSLNPQIISLVADPVSADIPFNSILTAIGSDPNGGTLSYSWYTGATLLASTNQTVVPIINYGANIFTCRVTNDFGTVSQDITVTGIAVSPSIINFIASPDTGGIEYDSVLTVTVNNPTSLALSYAWYDGITLLETTSVNQYTYRMSTIGTKTITVKVTSILGTVQADVDLQLINTYYVAVYGTYTIDSRNTTFPNVNQLINTVSLNISGNRNPTILTSGNNMNVWRLWIPSLNIWLATGRIVDRKFVKDKLYPPDPSLIGAVDKYLATGAYTGTVGNGAFIDCVLNGTYNLAIRYHTGIQVDRVFINREFAGYISIGPYIDDVRIIAGVDPTNNGNGLLYCDYQLWVDGVKKIPDRINGLAVDGTIHTSGDGIYQGGILIKYLPAGQTELLQCTGNRGFLYNAAYGVTVESTVRRDFAHSTSTPVPEGGYMSGTMLTHWATLQTQYYTAQLEIGQTNIVPSLYDPATWNNVTNPITWPN